MVRDYQRLWKDVTSTIDEVQAIRTLVGILADKEGRAFISRLEGKDAELCIGILDHVRRDLHSPLFRHLRWSLQSLAEQELTNAEKQAFFLTLRRLAGHHGRLPDSMIITEEIETPDTIPASGIFVDVKRGIYMGQLVAVKTMRVPMQNHLLMIRKVSIEHIFFLARYAALVIPLQQFCKEVVLWNTLSHPNVSKVVGAQGDMERGQFAIVSEWMVHGNVMEYIKNNHVNRLELVRDFASPPTSPSLKCDNSYTGRLRV